eukprot:1889201-Amphidinium_carterae.1
MPEAGATEACVNGTQSRCEQPSRTLAYSGPSYPCLLHPLLLATNYTFMHVCASAELIGFSIQREKSLSTEESP